MAEYIFQGGYTNKAGEVMVNLFLIHFKDESNIHFIYSPHLDLTGYGQNLKEAKKSFEIVFEDLDKVILHSKDVKIHNMLVKMKKFDKKMQKSIIDDYINSLY